MTPEVTFAGASLLLVVITSAVIVTRRLSQTEISLLKAIEDKQIETRKALLIEVDRSRHDFSETVSAIRAHADLAHTKIQEVELYIRDNYVEVGSFNRVMDRIEKVINSIDQKVDALGERNR